MIMKDFVNLFNYNDWANLESLDSLEKMENPNEKAIGIFSHLIIAQILWLSRVKKDTFQFKTFWEILPPKDARIISKDSSRAWLEFIRNKSENDFEISYSYKNSKGESFDSKLKDIIIHVINHSTYHRGQIAVLVRESGGIPAMTDYIHYSRKIVG
jgi:uncharacterized damage-inducible protein DinB